MAIATEHGMGYLSTGSGKSEWHSDTTTSQHPAPGDTRP